MFLKWCPLTQYVCNRYRTCPLNLLAPTPPHRRVHNSISSFRLHAPFSKWRPRHPLTPTTLASTLTKSNTSTLIHSSSGSVLKESLPDSMLSWYAWHPGSMGYRHRTSTAYKLIQISDWWLMVRTSMKFAHHSNLCRTFAGFAIRFQV